MTINKVGIVYSQTKELVGYLVKSPATGNDVCFYVDRWQFNGNFDSPTFSPSMLIYNDGYHKKEHFFVTDGKIIYLSDCDHDLAGKTIDMVDCDEDDNDDEMTIAT